MLAIDDIVEKVRRDHCWSMEEAARYASDYANFLTGAREETRCPTAQVDAIWHAHILHTRRYRADCHRLFGRFIDHEPFGPKSIDDARGQGLSGAFASCTDPVNCDSARGPRMTPSSLAATGEPPCVRPGPIPTPVPAPTEVGGA
jgi:hypothetical protein